MTSPLLLVNGLTTRFRTERGTVTAVDDVSFHVDPGETLAIGLGNASRAVPELAGIALIAGSRGQRSCFSRTSALTEIIAIYLRRRGVGPYQLAELRTAGVL